MRSFVCAGGENGSSELATKRKAAISHATKVVRAQAPLVYKAGLDVGTPHTYLDGTSPFTYQGLWAVGAPHSTATLSPGGPRGLYGLRLVHRLNISLSCFGPRAGQAIFLASALP